MGDHTEMHKALRYKRFHQIKKLLENGYNVNIRVYYSKFLQCATPLHYAIKNNRSIKIIQLLLQYGADVNAKCTKTPLYHAAKNENNFEIVKLLLEHGASLDLLKEHDLEYLFSTNEKLKNVSTIKLLAKYAMKDKLKRVQAKILEQLCKKRGYFGIIKLMVENGAVLDPEQGRKNKITPLTFACRLKDNFETVKCLVEHGAIINPENRPTPLIEACLIQDNFEAVKFLVEHGANVNGRSYSQETPLHYAVITENNHKVVQFLLEHGAEINAAKIQEHETPLNYAVQTKNNTETVKFLIERGANVNAINVDKSKSYNAIRGVTDIEFVKFLLENGVDSQIIIESLIDEIRLGQCNKRFQRLEELFLLLIQHGADINVKSKNYEETILCSVIRSQNAELVKVLLELSADTEATNQNGKTALNMAVQISTREIIMLLINHGANINSRDNSNRTPLFNAILIKNFPAVETLLNLDRGFLKDIDLNEDLFQQIRYYLKNSKTINFFLHYLIKVKVLNLVDEKILLLWKTDLDKLINFEIECKKEADKLRSNLICPDRNLTFLDLLTKSFRKVAVYLSLEDVRKQLDEIKFHEKFSIFSSMLTSTILTGKDLSDLLNKSYNSLQFLLRDLRLPYSFLTDILSYLNNKDLQVLSTI